jgi:histone deacetylase 6
MGAKTDVVSKDYVGWAVDNGFQVIDVNIPKVVAMEDVSTRSSSFQESSLTMMQDDGSYMDAEDPDDRATQTREVAAYIWENYIE